MPSAKKAPCGGAINPISDKSLPNLTKTDAMRDAATSLTHNGLLLALLVRLTKHEPLTEHRPVVRTSSQMCAAQENFNIAASPSWSWPHALGEREVGRGGSFASAAWPHAGAARKLGPGGVRTHQLCKSVGIDLARLTGRPRSMRANESTAHSRASTALRLRDPACLREGFASFFSCVRTWPQKSGVGRPNAGVEAAGLARRTWRLLGVLPVLLGAAISHFGHGSSVAIVSCAHGFTARHRPVDPRPHGALTVCVVYATCGVCLTPHAEPQSHQSHPKHGGPLGPRLSVREPQSTEPQELPQAMPGAQRASVRRQATSS